MDERKLHQFAYMFNINIEELKEGMKGEDIYSAISKLTGIERHKIKLIGHSLMYSIGIRSIPNGL